MNNHLKSRIKYYLHCVVEPAHEGLSVGWLSRLAEDDEIVEAIKILIEIRSSKSWTETLATLQPASVLQADGAERILREIRKMFKQHLIEQQLISTLEDNQKLF